ncbi:transcriptional regulator [Schinkia azotoformans MEV2011]|uniref:Transcriptional regulator n=1 Tax=Schinkia azotoformans MEV2011 TaxID=1348973 RepID=A0A072NP51_SCHAZ|nr:TetR/AcrR family transcriptional regulator [Schinkia azotoformans]KEF38663.1 transcriptional regulator [Schinkia azotoformans MEV2011]MEC1696906.1 TetR/AcrR family transcriptional regulator [Schinkia azotoformans]MEC1717879.1 TetR/AcrR family transcriptional regulator [Schinkia azotoformans]MEC1727245.1 TetR/AcrR family transcriptional regulator [Schinkia azotoformans]MEC1739728.1 TetR/AcrR family transcriptional regulator [Schinkia azotoformans]
MKELSPRALAKKKKIQLAAQRLFLKNGFSNTSMDTVTKEAKVSKQTIYSYYESKESLLYDVFQNLISEIDFEKEFQLTQRIEINNLNDLTAILEKIAERISKSLIHPEYLGLVRIILAEMSHFPELGELFKEAVPKQIMGIITKILLHANQKGIIEIDENNMDIIVRMLIGPVLTYILLDGLLVPKNKVNAISSQKVSSIVHYFVNSIS